MRLRCSMPALFLALALTAGARAQSDDAIATVNGEPISAADFSDRLQRLTVRDFVISTNPFAVRTQTAGQIVLDQLINERLTLQWAVKTNLAPTDTDLATDVAHAKAQPQVQQALAAHQLTEEFLKYSIRCQAARVNIATAGVTVSAQDVEKYYKDHLVSYTVPERYTIQGFVTTKQPEVAKIQEDLKAGKAFLDVMKAYCEDPKIKARNGEMGTISAADQTIPQPIREAAAVLKEGQVSPAIKVEGDPGGGKPKVTAWWFLRMTHREPSMTQPFPLVKAQVERAALIERAGGIQVADKKIADFRQVSEIKINLQGYESLAATPGK